MLQLRSLYTVVYNHCDYVFGFGKGASRAAHLSSLCLVINSPRLKRPLGFRLAV